LYLDAAYVVKHYLNEPESNAIRLIVRRGGLVASSALALAEVQCVFHRKMREGTISADIAAALSRSFLAHVDEDFWTLVPVTESVLRRAGAIVLSSPPSVFLRAGDAVHLTTAKDLGEKEVWTNDRHMLAAAPHFGLIGRSVA
jgi:predicted nucleic acid-binding protein